MITPDTLLQNRYLVVEQIGQGGMGAVYRAIDQRFGSTVALKETFFTDPNLRKAFEREAQLLNRLRHPALPRVSDHFNEEEGQFLVMEFITGSDLSEMLKERAGAPFTTREVLGWADQLLDALDYLHTQTPAVVHRDIKPQNLKLASRNQIILLDFGLAKGTPAQTRVTVTGSLFGYSFNYAPLEQMQGTGTDPRSDLYSLSATLHHLLTGQTPSDALSRATAVLNGQPDPLRPAHEINARVPAEISGVLSRAMSLNAAARPASAAGMRESLRRAGLTVQSDESEATTGMTRAVTTIADAAITEHETQLLDVPVDGSTRQAAVADTSINDSNNQETNAARDARTVMNQTHAVTQAHAADLSSGAASSVAGTQSVVTHFNRASESAPRRRVSGRTFGLAAGAVLIALIGTGIYTLNSQQATRDDTAPRDGGAAVQPAPMAQPAPEAEATGQPIVQPSATTMNRETTTPAPGASVESSNMPRRIVNTPTEAFRHSTPEPTPAEKRIIVNVPTPPQVVVPLPDFNPGGDVGGGGDRPLTRRDARALKRQMREEDFKAFILRQRAIEEQRRGGGFGGPRRRRGVPLPPPPER